MGLLDGVLDHDRVHAEVVSRLQHDFLAPHHVIAIIVFLIGVAAAGDIAKCALVGVAGAKHAVLTVVDIDILQYVLKLFDTA